MACNCISRNSGMNGQISRSQFLRTAGVGAAALGAVSMGFGRTAAAELPMPWAPDIVINASDFPAGAGQVAAVQSAVDGISPYDNSYVGPNILLRGEFNFGAPYPAPTTKPGTVFITRDVDIRGEKADGVHQTIINGGYRTFTVGLAKLNFLYNMDVDEGYAGNHTFVHKPASASIRDIYFKKPLNYAIWLSATRGETVISGCRFDDGVPLKWSFNQLPIARAITAWTAGIFRYPNQQTGFPRLNGSFKIFGNEMDGMAKSYDTNPGNGAILYSGKYWTGMSHFTYLWAMYGVGPTGIIPASIDIRENYVRNFDVAGIALGGLQGSSVVSGNQVDTGTYACPGYGAGLFLGEGGYFGEGSAPSSSTILSNNLISVGNGIGQGLWLTVRNQDVVVDSNEFQLTAGAYGVYINGITSSSVFKTNHLSGTCKYGFYVGSTSNDNLMVGNNVANLSVSSATYYFGPQTKDNVVKGYSGTVDSPDTNFITGWSPMQGAGGIGDEMAPAMTMEKCLIKGGVWDMSTETCDR